MNVHITTQMVFSLLRGIVGRFGREHVGTLPSGNGCAYVETVDGFRLVPSCIVAQVFADLGILRVLVVGGSGGHVVYDEAGNPYSNCGVIHGLRGTLAPLGVTFDDEAFNLLVEAQGRQDGNDTWGQVLDYITEKVALARFV